jgi:hypothetical protein
MTLEIVKVSTSPSGRGGGEAVRFRSRIVAFMVKTNVRTLGQEFFNTIFGFHMLTKNEKTNFVLVTLYVLVETMLQAAVKTQKYFCKYCC